MGGENSQDGCVLHSCIYYSTEVIVCRRHFKANVMDPAPPQRDCAAI